jgi:hypothetical protein
METYSRKSAFAELQDYCHLAKGGSFMEVTEWKNGEGFDVTIDSRSFSLTHGEFDLLNILARVR